MMVMSLLAVQANAADASNALPNAGFEDGIESWQIGEGGSKVVEEAARTGKMGLRVSNDGTKGRGSNATSASLSVTSGQEYTLCFWARSNSTSAGIYINYLNEKNQRVYDPNIKSGSPMIRIQHDDNQWHEYTFTGNAPELAKKVQIWVHTFSTANCVIDLDDFFMAGFPADVVAQAPKPYVEPRKPQPIDWDNIPKPDKPINIVLKLDDLFVKGHQLTPSWLRVVEYIDSKQIKATMGMLTEGVANASPEYCQWVKDHLAKGNWEIWFHGWDHQTYAGSDGKMHNEFEGRSYDQQQKRLADAQQLVYEKFGFHFTCFGPPGGVGTPSQDAVTHKIMIDDPYITTWLYPMPIDELGKQTNKQGDIVILDRVNGVGIEATVGAADFEAFVRGYIRNVKDRQYFTLQGHPQMWNDHRFEQFTKIVDFLIAQGANFVLPSEYSKTLR
jgi:peptidoglycan/xylan/chitin deacetylase (PgdA/CDA1 family)